MAYTAPPRELLTGCQRRTPARLPGALLSAKALNQPCSDAALLAAHSPLSCCQQAASRLQGCLLNAEAGPGWCCDPHCPTRSWWAQVQGLCQHGQGRAQGLAGLRHQHEHGDGQRRWGAHRHAAAETGKQGTPSWCRPYVAAHLQRETPECAQAVAHADLEQHGLSAGHKSGRQILEIMGKKDLDDEDYAHMKKVSGAACTLSTCVPQLLCGLVA